MQLDGFNLTIPITTIPIILRGRSSHCTALAWALNTANSATDLLSPITPPHGAWLTTATAPFTALTFIPCELAWKQHSRANPVTQQQNQTPSSSARIGGAYKNYFLTHITCTLIFPFTAPWREDIFHRQLYQVTSYSLHCQLEFTFYPPNNLKK